MLKMRWLFWIVMWMPTMLHAQTCTPPAQLLVEIGGFFGPSYKVEIVNQQLQYFYNPRTLISGKGTQQAVIQVSAAQWQQFCADLAHADVWHWQKEYVNSEARDGTQWQLKATIGDKTIITYGHNAYPQQFNALLSAVQKLIGEREFK